ncbi:MAG: carbonic anhydrase [Hyphomicrobiaceae bacterium]
MSTETNDKGIDADIADAIEGHQRFREQFQSDKAFFQGLATQTQKPRLLWIGCSDSRVVPAQITGADPGELFEIRNIANVVPPASAADDSVGAAIAYAVNHLGIDDIVVCGHTGCGGIKALSQMAQESETDTDPTHVLDPHLARWVDYTRPAHALVKAAGIPENERLAEAERAHIHFQIDNLLTYPEVSARVAAGTLGVHGWLYDMATGDLLTYDPATGTWPRLVDKTA